MSGYLPYSRFKWLKNVKELHVLHNLYPLAPEKLAIPYEMLSDYCKKLPKNMK